MMRYLEWVILAFVFSTPVIAGLPPTSVKGYLDSVFSTTFQFSFPSFPVTRSGTTATFGTLKSGGGGTGQTTYAPGDLLIGNNSGGLTRSGLTAGSNITITPGDGSITIASSGSGSSTPGICMFSNFTGNGSTNTTVMKFGTVLFNTSSDITCNLTNAATNGSQMTIVTSGKYAGGACAFFNAAANWCMTINSTGLTSNCSAIADSQTMGTSTSPANDNGNCIPFGPIDLTAGDVIRVQDNGNGNGGSAARSRFWLSRIQ